MPVVTCLWMAYTWPPDEGTLGSLLQVTVYYSLAKYVKLDVSKKSMFVNAHTIKVKCFQDKVKLCCRCDGKKLLLGLQC